MREDFGLKTAHNLDTNKAEQESEEAVADLLVADKSENTEQKTLLEELEDRPVPLRTAAYELLRQGKKQEAEGLVENCPSISEFREAAVEILENANLVHREKEGLVADLKKITQTNLSELLYKVTRKVQFSNKGQADNFYDDGVATNLYYIFRDLVVISQSDYELGKFEAKPLFYIPDSLDATFAPAQIQNNDFHLAPWEIGPVLDRNVYTKDGQEVNQFNEATALLLFHPKYGNGERDENGVLQVTYADGSRRPITVSFFEQYRNIVLEGKRSNDAIRYLLANTVAKELVERSLLFSSDFRPEHKKAHKAEETIIQSGIKANGLVSFYDQQKRLIRYYVSKSAEFTKDPNVEVVRLNDALAVVMKKNAAGRYISHYFNLTNYEDEHLSKASTNTGEFKVATASVTRVSEYDINSDKQDEAKGQELVRFSEILETANRIQTLSGVDILLAIKKQATWDNVLRILGETKQSPESIVDFIQKFGEEKLLLFLEINISADDFSSYLSLGENVEQVTAQKILDKYAEIVDLANKSQEELTEQLVDGSGDFEIDPSKEILERANKILLNGADKYRRIRQSGSQADYLQMMKELDRVKADLILTFAVYKNLKGRVKPEDLKGVSFEKISTQNFQGLELLILEMGKGKYPPVTPDEDQRIADLRQMFQLYELNYADRPELKAGLLSSFAKSLLTKNQTLDLFLIKKNERLIAYSRVEQEIGNGSKYFGSFNVLPEVQSLAIGEALFEMMKEKGFGESRVKAMCDAFSPASSLYIEQGDFVVDRSVTVKGARNSFEILREGKEKKYYYQNKSKEQIMSEAEAEPFDVENLSQQERFILSSASDFNKNLTVFLKLVDELGYKITRYFFDKASQKYYAALERASN